MICKNFKFHVPSMANFHHKNGVQTHGHILNFLREDCQPLYAASNQNCKQLLITFAFNDYWWPRQSMSDDKMWLEVISYGKDHLTCEVGDGVNDLVDTLIFCCVNPSIPCL